MSKKVSKIELVIPFWKTNKYQAKRVKVKFEECNIKISVHANKYNGSHFQKQK